MKNSLTAIQIDELKNAHKKEKNKKYADRIKIILALNEGYTFEEAARLFLVDDSTIRNYYKNYQEGGTKQLLKVTYQGKLSFLSLFQEQELKVFLSEHTFSSTRKIQVYIYKKYKIKFSCEGIRCLLNRLGLVFKKPKRIPGKISIEQQEEFVSKYEELKIKCNNENSVIYFADGVHPTQCGKTDYGWILKKSNKYLKTASSQSRVNIQGAVCYQTRNVISLSTETINAQSTIKLLTKIREQNHSKKNIYIILDNARYHHSANIKEWLSFNKKFHLIFLPPYSPNLNTIERLWKYLNKKVINNRYYLSQYEFKTKIRYFFSSIRFQWNELETLLIDHFQICESKGISEFKFV